MNSSTSNSLPGSSASGGKRLPATAALRREGAVRTPTGSKQERQSRDLLAVGTQWIMWHQITATISPVVTSISKTFLLKPFWLSTPGPGVSSCHVMDLPFAFLTEVNWIMIRP